VRRAAERVQAAAELVEVGPPEVRRPSRLLFREERVNQEVPGAPRTAQQPVEGA
jgi:hypothetical protein